MNTGLQTRWRNAEGSHARERYQLWWGYHNAFSMRKERVMTDATSLRSHIKSLEEQLRVLSAWAHSSTTLPSERTHALADLEGWLQGQADTTETDIDAILYRVPPTMDETL